MQKKNVLSACVLFVICAMCALIITGCQQSPLSFDELLIKANKGDPIAQVSIGDQYCYRKNYEIAIQWYKKALPNETIKLDIQKKINESERMLILEKAQDHYNNNEFLKAKKLWENLAIHGDCFAQYKIGELLENGCKDIPQDLDTAIKWYYRSALLNYGQAKTKIKYYGIYTPNMIQEIREAQANAAFWNNMSNALNDYNQKKEQRQREEIQREHELYMNRNLSDAIRSQHHNHNINGNINVQHYRY